MKMNKRGEEGGSPISLIMTVAIIVAVAFIVFFVIIKFKGSTNQATNLGGGESTVVADTTNCNLACSTNDQAGYCKTSKDVVWPDKGTAKGTCNELRQGVRVTFTNSENKQVSENRAISGINDCSSICGPAVATP